MKLVNLAALFLLFGHAATASTPSCNITSCGPLPPPCPGFNASLKPPGGVPSGGSGGAPPGGFSGGPPPGGSGTPGFASPCLYDESTKRCTWQLPPCGTSVSSSVCNITTCGRPPRTARRLCPDGKTRVGPGPCLYNNVTKKCAYQVIHCPSCTTTSDCTGGGQFCGSDNLCRALGTCATSRDCVNPFNSYTLSTTLQKDCVLCLACEQNKCARSCTPCSNVCPSKTNFASCNGCSIVRRCFDCKSTCSAA